jgi:hypothetical protein
MKVICTIAMTVFLTAPQLSRASIFGEENATLIQILYNAIEQLAQLRRILDAGEDTLNLLRDINNGINDSLSLLKTIDPNTDRGIYKDWTKATDAVKKLQSIYGLISPSPDSKIQQDTDQQIAEAISFNNAVFDYTEQIDQIGEQVKQFSHQVSPGGAQKLTAQTLGVMLHVMNSMLRTQASTLKLNAQTLAIQNKKDKEFVRNTLAVTEQLKTAMKADSPKFEIPRF